VSDGEGDRRLARTARSQIRVEEAETVSTELVDAMHRLIPQVSTSAEPLTEDEIETIVSSPVTRLLVARGEEGSIVGTLTLVVFRIPTGVGAWIEDVVVDERARRQGVGEALMTAAIRLAEGSGARHLNLTSRPDREAANRLYRRLGFDQRETNVYRLMLPAPPP
jgi:ribosomal protein S18 acetylase RimI-like enzyme